MLPVAMEYKKLSISLPTPMFEKIERLRHDVRRSIFIQHIIEKHLK